MTHTQLRFLSYSPSLSVMVTLAVSDAPTLFYLMRRLDAQTLLVLSNHVLSLSIIVMVANDRPSMLTSGSELDRAMPTVSVSSSILSSVVVTCMQTDWLDSYVRLWSTGTKSVAIEWLLWHSYKKKKKVLPDALVAEFMSTPSRVVDRLITTFLSMSLERLTQTDTETPSTASYTLLSKDAATAKCNRKRRAYNIDSVKCPNYSHRSKWW